MAKWTFPPCLTSPALTFLHVQARTGLGRAPSVQCPGLSAPVPQPPLPPSLEEEVHQCLGALQGPLLPRGPRLLLLPLLLLFCRHEGAPGRLEGGQKGRTRGRGVGRGREKGEWGTDRVCSHEGRWGWGRGGAGALLQFFTPPLPTATAM